MLQPPSKKQMLTNKHKQQNVPTVSAKGNKFTMVHQFKTIQSFKGCMAFIWLPAFCCSVWHVSIHMLLHKTVSFSLWWPPQPKYLSQKCDFFYLACNIVEQSCELTQRWNSSNKLLVVNLEIRKGGLLFILYQPLAAGCTAILACHYIMQQSTGEEYCDGGGAYYSRTFYKCVLDILKVYIWRVFRWGSAQPLSAPLDGQAILWHVWEMEWDGGRYVIIPTTSWVSSHRSIFLHTSDEDEHHPQHIWSRLKPDYITGDRNGI